MYDNRIANLSLIFAAFVVAIHVCFDPAIGAIDRLMDVAVAHGVGAAAVPFFFVVSGFFLARTSPKEGWYLDAVRKRAKSILLPYLCWSLIIPFFSIPNVLLANIMHGRSLLANFTIFNAGWSILGLDLTAFPHVVPLWFLRSLFLYVILSPVLIWIVRRLGYVGMAILFAILVGVQPNLFVFLPNPGVRFLMRFIWPEGLFFFMVGTLLVVKPIGLRAMTIRRVGFVSIFVSALIVGINCYSSFHCGKKLYYLELLSIPFTLMAAWTVPLNCEWRFNFKGLSMGVYLLHIVIIAYLQSAFSVVKASSAIVNSLIWILATVCTVVALWIVKRIAPGLLSVLLGGRAK